MPEVPPPSRLRSLPQQVRQAHASVAPFVIAPLLLTASTGMAYRVLRDWLGWGRDRAHVLMVLHEGEWLKRFLGTNGETIYVALNGFGLLWMLGTGLWMVGQRLLRWRGAGGKGA